MTITTIGYFAALIFAVLAAMLMKRWRLAVLIGCALALSALFAVLGSAERLTLVMRAVGFIAIVALATAGFRRLLIAFLPAASAREIAKSPTSAVFGLLVIVVYAACALFAPFIAPYGQGEIVSSSFSPPSADHLLGADQLGRDIFSRVIYGARNSVGIALMATLLAFGIGSVLGLFAAMRGGWVDQILGRLMDVMMSVPSLIFSLLMLSIFGTDFLPIILVVAAIYAPRVYRLTRSVAGNIVVMDYVEAARLRGERTWYLIRKEILPNALSPLIAEFGLEFCFVFLLIAGLSFLGLGVQPPTADWGSMVRENATLISFGDLTPLIPAAAIALLTVAVNFVIDWMLHRSSGLKEG